MTKIGLMMWPTDYSISAVDAAVAAEERGFESIFVPDHSHIPVSRLSPYPEGGELPKQYLHLLDPLVALTAMASVTTRLRVGTAICLVVERDPIALAKQIATIDHVSHGRFELGVGGGWNKEEMANHGTDFSLRWQILQERVEAMRAVWANDEAEFHGRHVDFDPIWSWPKPDQRPGPPVLIGGSGPRTLQRVVDYGDGWIPVGHWEGDALWERLEELRRLAKEHGRPDPPVTIVGVAPKADVIASLAERGIHRALIAMPVVDRDESLRRMDRYAQVLG